MIKLLSANLKRLKNSKTLLIITLGLILISLFMIFTNYNDYKTYGTKVEFDNLFNFFLVFIGIITAIFTSLFLSTEYSDMTLRNKIIIGHSRLSIYLSNLITVILVSLFFELIYILIISVLGIPLFGFNLGFKENFIYTLIITQLIIITYSSINTFISLTYNNAVVINVICILFAFGSYFLTIVLLGIVETPEYITNAIITKSETNEIEYVKEKNPKYPSKLKKEICNKALEIIPQSQSILIASNKVRNKKILPVYSVSITLIITTLGLIIFKRKDLK